MGIQESQEEAHESLIVLQKITVVNFDKLMMQLDTLVNKKFTMSISKWDLIKLLPFLTLIQIKQIMKMIMNQPDPVNISVHALIVALVLTRDELSSYDKITKLIGLICYKQDREGKVMLFSEVDYVFHLVYCWINSVTGLKISSSEIQKSTQNEVSINKDGQCSVIDVIDHLASLTEIDDIFQIFTKETRKMEQQKLGDQKIINQSPKHKESKVEFNFKSLVQSDGDGQSTKKKGQATRKGPESKKSANNFSQVALKGQKTKLTAANDEYSQLVLNKPRIDYSTSLKQPLRQLMWNAQILTKIHDLNPGQQPLANFDHLTVKEVNKMLQVLHKKSLLQSGDESLSEIIEIQRNISDLQRLNLDFYGQRQFTQMLTSIFFEKKLVKASSINAFIAQNPKEITNQEKILVKAQSSLAFKNFFAQNLGEIRYELKQCQQQRLYHMQHRGQRRILEKKKYKTLGEIEVLVSILTHIEDREAQIIEQKKQQDAMKLKRSTKKVTKIESRMNGLITFNSNPVSGEPSRAASLKSEKYADLLSYDYLFENIYSDFDQLKMCGVGRLQLAQLLALKSKKSETNHILSFLEGAKEVLTLVKQVNVFNELNHIAEMDNMVMRSIGSENTSLLNFVNERDQLKHTLNYYNTLLGKLKAYHFTIEHLQTLLKESDIVWMIKARIQLLQRRVSMVDEELVKTLIHKANLKKSTVQYFKSEGKIAIYKVLSRNLSTHKLFDYMGIVLCKSRMQEAIILSIKQNPVNPKVRMSGMQNSSKATSLLGCKYKMSQMIEIDKYFNLETSSQDSEHNFEKFTADMMQIIEEEKVKARKAEVGIGEPLHETNYMLIVKGQIKDLYTRFRVPGQVQQYVLEEVNFTPIKPLNGEITYLGEKLDDVGSLIFDFLSMEDETTKTQTDDGFHYDQNELDIKKISEISSSLKCSNYSKKMSEYRQTYAEGHASCCNLAIEMKKFSENNYIQSFLDLRFSIFREFMLKLREANRGNFIGNFDMNTLSMPQEFSLQTNYSTAMAFQQLIDEEKKLVKQEIFEMIKSLEVNNRRETWIVKGQKHPGQLMQCFFQPPFNVIPECCDQDTLSKLTKNKQIQTHKYSMKFFGELQLFIEAQEVHESHTTQIIKQFYQNQLVHDLSEVQRYLSDYLFESEDSSIVNINQNHLELQIKILESKRPTQFKCLLQGCIMVCKHLVEVTQHNAIEIILNMLVGIIDKLEADEEDNLKQKSTHKTDPESFSLEEVDSASETLNHMQQKIIKVMSGKFLAQRILFKLKQGMNGIRVNQLLGEIRNELIAKQVHLKACQKFLKANSRIDDYLGCEKTRHTLRGSALMIDLLSGLYILDSKNIEAKHEPSFFLITVLQRLWLLAEELNPKEILISDSLFASISLFQQLNNGNMSHFNLNEALSNSYADLTNVHELLMTPLSHYLANYSLVCKYVMRDMIPQIVNTMDKAYLKFVFMDIQSKKGASLIKSTFNQMEKYLALIDISDNIDCQQKKTYLKKLIDKKLRCYKEFVDYERQKQVSQLFLSTCSHLEMCLMRELASLLILINTYSIKTQMNLYIKEK